MMTTQSGTLSSQTDIFPNPPTLPPRFQIRRLTTKHVPWASAIVIHSNIFHSPVWSLIYPENKIVRAKRGWDSVDHLVRHQIESGYSFGMFDTEWRPRRSDTPSGPDGGACYFNEFFKEKSEADLVAIGDERGEKELHEAMDFPLVSVALSYDQVDPLDHDEVGKMIEVLPLFGTSYAILGARDTRDPASWGCEGRRGEVLMRNATSTRRSYEGMGIMKGLAQFLMKYAAEQGFRGINIECAHNAVRYVWMNPPAPFKSELVSSFDCKTYEGEDEKGERKVLYEPSTVVCTKVWCVLK